MDITKDIHEKQLGAFVKINLYNRELTAIRQNSVNTSISLGGKVLPCTIQSSPENNVQISVNREYPGKLRVQLSRGFVFEARKYFVVVYLKNCRTMERATDIHVSQLSFLPTTWDIDIDPEATYHIRINACHYSDIVLDKVNLHIVQEKQYVSNCREVFSKYELQRLEQKARGSTGIFLRRIQYFYRNKPDNYFDTILNGNGIMEPYIKDMNGDPKCPINGRINGLFFMGRPDKSNPNNLPQVSPFGPRRFVIPAHRLFDSRKNLYFSDFWCHNKEHYVSLVITVPGSEADRFCSDHILELDKHSNSYLRLGIDGKISISDSVWVEVLYTEAIDIRTEELFHGAYMTRTRAIGPGQSTRLGLAKKSTCRICNL